MVRTFDAEDAWLLGAGRHTRLWEVLGAHGGPDGTTFRVWAPGASAVSVVGDRNRWTPGADPLTPDPSGVWRGTLAGWSVGDRYKYSVVSGDGRHRVDKTDPVGFGTEIPPRTASVITDLTYEWADDDWLAGRTARQAGDRPISVYEVHLGSWRYEPGGYAAIGRQLAQYCTDMGFTHVELLPVMEHPFYGSWGYQTTGYFAPTARYGHPTDLMALTDELHRNGIGLILDWVPSHFPTDEHGLGFFDGTHLYEHADPRQGFHPDWKSYIYNYGRPEVRAFLTSSAHYWIEVFHADGLRVDAVASMLYLDYSRDDGAWIPNADGGNDNREAIHFLRELNSTVAERHPGVLVIAEESTAWPGVTAPTDEGGLGFDLKWDMGWMHDTLDYLAHDPVHRAHHHDRVTFRSMYASSEHYVLPLSHDEVVHGKGSLLTRMPGDRWQQFANLRLLLGLQFLMPGKKLLFMGGELAMAEEWDHESELPWACLADAAHAGVQGWVRRLNELYATEPALHEVDRDPAGFGWVVGDDRSQSVYAFLRYAPDARPVLAVVNATPIPRQGYQVGVPASGRWELLADSDDPGYGGSGVSPGGRVDAVDEAAHGHPHRLDLELPPLAVLVLAPAD